MSTAAMPQPPREVSPSAGFPSRGHAKHRSARWTGGKDGAIGVYSLHGNGSFLRLRLRDMLLHTCNDEAPSSRTKRTCSSRDSRVLQTAPGKCNSTKVVWGLSIGVVMGARPSGARVGSTEDPSQTQARFAWFASEGHLTGSVIFRAHAPGRYKRGPGGLAKHRHLWKPALESEAGSVCEHGCLVPAGRKQLRIEALVCSSGKCLFLVVWKPRLHRSHVDPVEFALSILARQKEGLDREKDWWRHSCIITLNHILAEAT